MSSRPPLRSHMGPTDTDPDPGKQWCSDCGGEVYGIEGVLGCSGCGAEEAPYPAQIVIWCDCCGVENAGDYLVRDSDDAAARYGFARKHLLTLGWRCDETGDFCPDHANTPEETP